MRTAYATALTPAPGFEPPPEFKLLIAYEDFANGRRAMMFLERLVEEFGRLFTFVPRFLKFEDLTKAQVAEQMEKEALEADLVVVAAYADGEWPGPARAWIRELEIRRGKRDRGLVSLLNSRQEASPNDRPAQWRLRAATKRGRSHALRQPVAWATKEEAFPVEITWRSHARLKAEARPTDYLAKAAQVSA